MKKRVAAWLFENRNLSQAACLHALCEAEARSYRDFGLRNPICIIPNGVDVPEVGQKGPEARRQPWEDFVKPGRKRLLFLSRIHPKKGLVNLLRAWKGISPLFNDWCLMVAGPDEVGHEAQLRSLCASLGIDDSVYFIGQAYGEDKRALLAAADAFVLPSFSEGISMAVLEAAGAALPVVLTHQCNFPQLAKAGGAIKLSEASGISAGLEHS